MTIRRIHLVISLILIAGVLIMLAGCSSQSTPVATSEPIVLDTGAEPTETPQALPSEPNSQRTTSNGKLAYTADIRARSEVNLVPKVSGRIEEMNVDVGDRVSAGEVIAVLEHSMLNAQVAQAQAGVASAQANLAKMKAQPRKEQVALAQSNVDAAQARLDALQQTPFTDQVQTAQHNLERAKNALWQAQSARDVACANTDGVWQEVPTASGPRGMLVAPGGNCTAAEAGVGQAEEGVALANVQLEQVKQGPREQEIAQAQSAVTAAQQQLELAKAPFVRQDFDAAQGQINAAAAALEIAKLNRDEATIKAPIDGIISAKQGTVGMMVAPGTTPIVSIVSEDVQVSFGVDESLVGRLNIGQPATLTVAAYPGETFSGRVAIIAPVADLTTRTFAVTVYPDDPSHKLRPGMFADLALEVTPQS